VRPGFHRRADAETPFVYLGAERQEFGDARVPVCVEGLHLGDVAADGGGAVGGHIVGDEEDHVEELAAAEDVVHCFATWLARWDFGVF
jgi:hypothetical protein